MTRLAKKCVIASSIMHGTLLLMLLLGPAFLPSEKPIDPEQIIDFIPFKTLEQSMSGGGTPNVEQTIPRQLPEQQPKPQTPQKQEQAPPAKREEPKQTKPAKPAVRSEPKIKVNLKQITRPGTEPSTPSRNHTRDNGRSEPIQTAINTISKGGSPSVQLQKLRGPGGGGIPYAGFNDALISAYMRAWLIPADAAEETSKVVVTITLSRDGRVISSRIQTRSGNSALDASVQRALDKVTFVAPFPDSVKDAQKTFWLEFDPRAKRMMG